MTPTKVTRWFFGIWIQKNPLFAFQKRLIRVFFKDVIPIRQFIWRMVWTYLGTLLYTWYNLLTWRGGQKLALLSVQSGKLSKMLRRYSTCCCSGREFDSRWFSRSSNWSKPCNMEHSLCTKLWWTTLCP